MRAVGFLIGAFSILWGFILGGDAAALFDAWTFLILMTGAFAFTYMGHGRVLWSALKAAINGQEADPARRAYFVAVLNTLRRTLLWTGFAIAFVGAANMSKNLDDWSHFGAAFAVLLLSPLYGIVFAELMLGPLINRLELLESP